jgi:predicted DNA-binding protein
MGGAFEHRHLQALDADLGRALARAARRARKSPARLLRELVLEYLRDQEDYLAAARARARIKKGARTYSHAGVKKQLGLEG